ncbi:MAG: hypothetical protein M3P06_19550 [Acidobacteriota bacterium]|nr:hypothetical protein [Acidobacteriota bacterium]
MTVALFDTSAINNLLDDPLEPELTSNLFDRYSVYISLLNLLEIAKTSDPVRREALRRFIRKLRDGGDDDKGGFAPLDLPNHLLRQVCQRFSSPGPKLRWSVADERHDFDVAISAPSAISEEARLEAMAWCRELEANIAESNASFRERLQREVFSHSPKARPKTAADLFRRYLRASWPLRYGITAKIYKRETGKVLPLSRLDDLLGARPSIWPLFLMAYAFSIYYGSMWSSDFGTRNPAGIIDLMYAVYLPVCDVFVTHDMRHGGQYDALRLLNVFSSRSPRAHVLNWNHFRAQLLTA